MAPCVCKPSRAFLPSVPGPRGPGVVRSGYGPRHRLRMYWLRAMVGSVPSRTSRGIGLVGSFVLRAVAVRPDALGSTCTFPAARNVLRPHIAPPRRVGVSLSDAVCLVV